MKLFYLTYIEIHTKLHCIFLYLNYFVITLLKLIFYELLASEKNYIMAFEFFFPRH